MKTHISKTLRYARKQKAMTQKELSEQIGVNVYTISDWEQGRGKPSLEQLKAISIVLEVDINDFLDIENPQAKKVFLEGLELLNLEQFKELSREDKKLLAQNFNALLDRLKNQ